MWKRERRKYYREYSAAFFEFISHCLNYFACQCQGIKTRRCNQCLILLSVSSRPLLLIARANKTKQRWHRAEAMCVCVYLCALLNNRMAMKLSRWAASICRLRAAVVSIGTLEGRSIPWRYAGARRGAVNYIYDLCSKFLGQQAAKTWPHLDKFGETCTR